MRRGHARDTSQPKDAVSSHTRIGSSAAHPDQFLSQLAQIDCTSLQARPQTGCSKDCKRSEVARTLWPRLKALVARRLWPGPRRHYTTASQVDKRRPRNAEQSPWLCFSPLAASRDFDCLRLSSAAAAVAHAPLDQFELKRAGIAHDQVCEFKLQRTVRSLRMQRCDATTSLRPPSGVPLHVSRSRSLTKPAQQFVRIKLKAATFGKL